MYKFAPPRPLLWALNRNKPTQIRTPSWNPAKDLPAGEGQIQVGLEPTELATLGGTLITKIISVDALEINSKNNSHTFFVRQKKKGFSFFSCGATTSRTVPKNPARRGCLFSTRKSRPEVPERQDFGEENCLGKGGVDRAKKGCTKKGGFKV